MTLTQVSERALNTENSQIELTRNKRLQYQDQSE